MIRFDPPPVDQRIAVQRLVVAYFLHGISLLEQLARGRRPVEGKYR